MRLDDMPETAEGKRREAEAICRTIKRLRQDADDLLRQAFEQEERDEVEGLAEYKMGQGFASYENPYTEGEDA